MAKYLGQSNEVPFTGLELIPTTCNRVIFECTEVTALCPVTHNPDLYKVTIDLYGQGHTIESKSLKLYLQTFRNVGIFAENLAVVIQHDLAKFFFNELSRSFLVTVEQQSRGGISITAVA